MENQLDRNEWLDLNKVDTFTDVESAVKHLSRQNSVSFRKLDSQNQKKANKKRKKSVSLCPLTCEKYSELDPAKEEEKKESRKKFNKKGVGNLSKPASVRTHSKTMLSIISRILNKSICYYCSCSMTLSWRKMYMILCLFPIVTHFYFSCLFFFSLDVHSVVCAIVANSFT